MNLYQNEIQLGNLLTGWKVITDSDLKTALSAQEQSGLPLGLQLFIQDKIHLDTLRNVILLQSYLRDRVINFQQAEESLSLLTRKQLTLSLAFDLVGVDIKTMRRNRLGDFMAESGCLSREQIKRSLRLSKETGLPLGRVIVNSGAASSEIVKQALLAQRRVRSEYVKRDDAVEMIHSSRSFFTSIGRIANDVSGDHSRLGYLLFTAGCIDEAQLSAALSNAQIRKQRLGEALLEMDSINTNLLEFALEIQNLLRSGIFSIAHGIKLLKHAREHHSKSGSTAPPREDIQPDKKALSFKQFLKLCQLLKTEVNVHSNSICGDKEGDELETTVESLNSLRKLSGDMKSSFPESVADCLARHGFYSQEQQIEVAKAAHSFNLGRAGTLSIEQSLILFRNISGNKDDSYKWESPNFVLNAS